MSTELKLKERIGFMPRKKKTKTINLPLEEYLKYLYNFGYLVSEKDDPLTFEEEDLFDLPPDLQEINSFLDPRVEQATYLFQKKDRNIALLKEATNQPLIEDGVPGFATFLTTKIPRCRYKDTDTEPALGIGGWKGCHNFSTGHKVIAEVSTSTIPRFLSPHLKQILTNVQRSYAEIGLWLVFRREDNKEDMLTGEVVEGTTNITISWTSLGGNTIGLAIVGNGKNQTCSSTIWAKFNPNYKPADIIREWTTLIKHEIGHCCGLRHTNGGVMNPSIIRGLAVSWKGDPSFNNLVRWFSGIPIEIDGNPNPDDPNPPTPAPVPVGSPLSEPFKLETGDYGVIIKVPNLNF